MISILNLLEQATESDERTNKKIRHIANSALIGGLIGAGAQYLHSRMMDPVSRTFFPTVDQMVKGGLLTGSVGGLLGAYEASSKQNPYDNDYNKLIKNNEKEKKEK